MSRWWDTDMADAGQALYADPAMAIQAAIVPQELTQAQAEFKKDQEEARKDRGGFLGAITEGLGKADAWMSNIPGWGVAKNIVWTPIDKTASGLYWMYSNVVSQPISTLLLQAAKSEIAMEQGGSFWGTMTSGDEWGDAYHKAEHISPGQAFVNYENVMEASGNAGLLSELFGDAGEELSEGEKKRVKQNMERFLYDSDYWQDKGGWKYTVGSGSLDFMFNILDPASAAVISGATKTVKGARSVEFAPQEIKYYEGANKATRMAKRVTPFVKPTGGGADVIARLGQPGVARTRGPVLDLFTKQQTPEEVAQLPSLQKSFDWMKAEGRTTEEIANHPIWGRGRRINPARYDIARLIKDTPRDQMERVWRFAAGDSLAGRELAAEAPELLKKIGQVADNRALVDGIRLNPAMISAFKAESEGLQIPRDSSLLIEPPYPRPAEPGPRQDGWDRTWGNLARQSEQNRMVANAIASTTPVRLVGDAERTMLADALKAEEWKKAKLQTIADDYDELVNNEKWLGGVLGTMDEWTPTMSPLFGTIGRFYRSGGLAVRDTEKAAEKLALSRAGRKPKPRGGNFVMTTVKRGMGAPMVIVHAMGDRTPQGFVNHNSDDARDRVFDMLKQVKGMEPQQRLDLIELYSSKADKVGRAEALKEIHKHTLNHILVNNGKMDPELATALRDAITDGITDKLMRLTGGAGRQQRFGPSATTPEEIARLKPDAEDMRPVRSDRVYSEEDGSGIILSPLARTQLEQSDILLPIKEIQRLVDRSSSSFRELRLRGGDHKDTAVAMLDGFDNLWKAATLLRPGFIPRMVSDEVFARMFKFGGMATLMDTSKGMAHFLSNRSRQVGSIMGVRSYVPTTGKELASKRARVILDDEAALEAAEKHGLPVKRIKVSPTLRMVYGRIQEENKGLRELQRELAKETKKKRGSPGYVASLRDEIADSEMVIKEYHDYIGEILRVAEVSKGRRLGDRDFVYKVGKTTYRVPSALSGEWENPIPRDQISSRNAWRSLFTRGEQIDRQRFLSHQEKTGSWVIVDPDKPNHMESWLNALNLQMRQDPFHRMVAGGKTDKELMEWLTRNPNGRQYMSEMGYWNRNKEQFITNVRFMMDKYLADDVLRQKLANGEIITEAELRSAFTREEFPAVHGEEIKEHSALTYRETTSARIDRYMERAWTMVADIPSDVMSRNPVYLQFHKAEMQELIRQQYHYKMQKSGDDTITLREWELMNQKADKLARGKIRQVVYDPVNTSASQALRFIYPFFKPYIDGIDRWAGLIAERPEQLTKLARIYNAPVAANLVTDREGNQVKADGYVMRRNPITGETEKVFVPLKERVLHLKAPWAKPGGKEYAAISVQSLNTILPGDPWFDPGAGPIVQVPANQLAKSSPQMGEFLQWAKILPFGPQESTLEMLTPKYLRQAYDAYIGQDTENEKYQAAVLDVYNMEVAKYHEAMRRGESPDPPKMKDIQAQAKKFLWLQALTTWLSPVSVKTTPLTGTKYQFFADAYSALQAHDPQNARDLFLSQFGEEYFGFTAALTESAGIAATISADQQMEKYRDLIAEDPDMASLVVGDVYNGGPFSAPVYQKQLHDEIGGKRVRRRLTAEEAINKSREQEGWRQYMAAVTELDAELIRAGFRSYAQKGAEGFVQAKRQVASAIAANNPAWSKAYGTTDREKIPSRIRFMEKAVLDERIMKDPLRQDMHTLLAYLQVRQQFKAALSQRGLTELSYDAAGQPVGQALDIGYAWRQAQMQLVNQSVGFGQLYNRYLSSDDLQ